MTFSPRSRFSFFFRPSAFSKKKFGESAAGVNIPSATYVLANGFESHVQLTT